MDIELLRSLSQRLDTLERDTVRFRLGVVTSASPLSVALGGSTIPYTNVQTLAAVASGDTVAVLTFGNDLLIQGTIGGSGVGGITGLVAHGPFTVTSASFAAGTEGTVSYTHGLGVTPTLVLGMVEDGNFAAACSWRVVRSSTQIQFVARNNHPSAAATVKYTFMIYATV